MRIGKWFYSVIGVSLIILVFLTSVIASQGEKREASEPQPLDVTMMNGSSSLADQLVQAIAKPSLEPRIVQATYEGIDAQAEIFSIPLQEFPRSGNQYILLSTGAASNTPGTATTYSSMNMGGIHIPGGSPDGFDAYDVATLTVRLDLTNLPTDPSPRLLFRYKFCSEEPPSYWGSLYQDYFTVILIDSSGQIIDNIARLPDGNLFTIDNARPFMNPVTGNSSGPLPPYPNPNDVVFNACTGIHTTDYDLTAWANQEIEVEFQIGDVSDAILDSAVFIDGLEIVAGPLPDFSVERVEFNQAIQSFEAGANVAASQLVAGKQTVVRVYVKGENNEEDPKRVSAALHVYKNGSPIIGSPFTPSPRRITPVLNPSRIARDANDRPTQTLQFYLPSTAIAGTGQYEYFVMVDPDNEVDESDVLNNRFPETGFNTFTLHEREELRVLGYRVNTVNNNGAVDTWDDTDETRYATGRSLTHRMFPAPAVQFWRVGDGMLEWNLDTDGDLSTRAGRTAVLNHIVELLEDVNDWSTVGYHTVVAMFPRDTSMDARGFAWPGRPGAVARTLEPDTLPHELGHNWLPNGVFSDLNPGDPNHECTTSANDGFDVVMRQLRLNRPSLMCGGQVNRWVSPATYSALFNNNQLTTATTTMLQGLSQIEALRIRGIISENSLTLSPIYTIQAETITEDDPLGNYVVELQDQYQGILTSVRFQLAEIIEHDGSQPVTDGRFSLVVPRPAGLKFVVIKSLETSEILETVTVSDNPPIVTIVSPSGGENIDGTFTISWEGSDPDNDPLTYIVLYSHDGDRWGVLANNVTETNFVWDASQSPGGFNALIRVVVTDGVNSASDVSAPFTVPTKPPEALIIAPHDNAEIPLGAMAIFVGVADDPEDGELSGEQMEWSSDLDGILGIGESIAATDLSPGYHTITLTATDSDGNTDNDSINILVLDTTLQPPTGLQAFPGDQQVTLQWNASTEEFLEGYRVYWGTSSGIYGADVDVGNVTNYTISNLTNGTTYYFAVTAYDFADNESSFSIEVQATPTPQTEWRLYLPIIMR